jgi:hypothetical protein
MLLREFFENPSVDAAFCFGRFNPAHCGHVEVWKAVENSSNNWFVGTNPSTHGPNDPLVFEEKTQFMEAMYPKIQGHIIADTSVLTVASKIFKQLQCNENATIAYITDSKDWQWSGKLLNEYNGKAGPHGYYKFATIKQVASPRVSSATALREAARDGDRNAFYEASGADPTLMINKQSYFDTVVAAVRANPKKIKL